MEIRMKNYKFLVPVGLAVAAISPAQASIDPTTTSTIVPSSNGTIGLNANDAIVQRLAYQLGTEEHSLLMKRTETGTLYAFHQSHGSHGSHSSHRSSAS